LTLALDGGEWSASRPGRALPPGERTPVPIGQEAGWAAWAYVSGGKDVRTGKVKTGVSM